MTIRHLAPAREEIDEAYTYYESQIKGLGAQFLDEILHLTNSIRSHPGA